MAPLCVTGLHCVDTTTLRDESHKCTPNPHLQFLLCIAMTPRLLYMYISELQLWPLFSSRYWSRSRGQYHSTHTLWEILPTPYGNTNITMLLCPCLNTSIATFENRSLALDLGLCQAFWWIFIVADVKHSILGADFLRSYNLLVDKKHHRLSDTLTELKVQSIISQAMSSPSPTIFP